MMEENYYDKSKQCSNRDTCPHLQVAHETIKDLGNLAGHTTEALIAELEKRRPCKQCSENDPEKCSPRCLYYHGPIQNNFKEAK